MKKFLSILLAVMLIGGVLPTAFAATIAENGNTVYNYVFSSKALGSDTAIGLGIQSGTAIDTTTSPLGGYMDYDDIVPSVSDKWDLLVLRSAHGCGLYADGLYYRASTSTGNVVTSGANAAIAMKIEVPETGKYIPTAVFDGAYNGGIADIYLVKTTATTSDLTTHQNNVRDFINSSNTTPIGEVDTYAPKGTDAAISGPEIKGTFDAMDLEKGDYYLVFALKDINSARKSAEGALPGLVYMETKSFHLEKIAPASVEISADAEKVEVGGTTTVSAKAFGANSEELPDEVTFESSAPSVAIVDATTGVVTAKTAGNAIITATVNGTDITDSVTITVTKTYTYNFSATATGYPQDTDLATGDKVDYSLVEEKGLSEPWDFISNRSMAVVRLRTKGFYARTTTSNLGDAKNGLVFKIKIAENGVYAPTLKYSGYSNGGTVATILANADEVDALSYNMTDVGGSGGIVRAVGKYAPAGSISTRNSAISNENFGTITPYQMDNVNLVKGEYYLIFTMPNAEETPAAGNYVYFLISSLELTKVGDYTPAEDETLSGAFDAVEEEFTSAPLSTATVNTFTATLCEDKDSTSATITSKTVNLGEACTVEAPEAPEGHKFLYWAKGLSTDRKKIVSYDEVYTFIPTVENTYLIAVYDAADAEHSANKAEFYNANGQLIETLTENGKAPALPEMAGYNGAEGWALYGSDEVIEAGADVEVEGTKVYVAKFGNPKTVKVNGEEVKYGDKVSFTAAPGVGEIFKAWKKDGVIVSTAETYEFYAWKDCTVEAVYVNKLPTFTGIARKILIDTFSAGDKTAVMAEFIGFEGAVEKGIMLGNKRYAMTTNASQFTIVNDENAGEIKGYAIFKDGTIVFDN